MLVEQTSQTTIPIINRSTMSKLKLLVESQTLGVGFMVAF